MDHILTQLDQLEELGDEDITTLHDSIISEFETVEGSEVTPQSVDAMSQLADGLDRVRSEQQRREAQAEELASRAAEAVARVRGKNNPEEELPVTEDEDDSVPADAEEPAVEPTEDEDDKKKKKNPFTEASTDVQETAELAATDTETVIATEPVTEAATEVVEEVKATKEPSAEETAQKTALAVEPEVEVAAEPVAVEEPKVEEAPVVEEEAPVEEAPATETAEAPSEELSVETPAVVEVEAPAETEAATDTTVEAEASTEEINNAQEAQEEAITVTAAADGAVTAPADRLPVVQNVEQTPVAITAGADIQGYTAGSTLSDQNEVASAMSVRLRSVRNVSGGDGEQLTVASFNTQYPDSRVLTSDVDANQRKINDVVGPDALVASGGFATPLQVRYDIFGFGTDVRPVRDSLPKFQADRGGISFITPPVLSSYSNAVGIWTNENDKAAAGRYDGDAGTPDGPVKNTLVVGSANKQEEYVDAVTLQLQFGNLLTRAFPELIARHNELALIQHARQAELNLLSKINAKSTAVTTSSVIGFARDFLVQVRRAAAAYRSRHRIDRDTQLRAIIPTWVVDAMAADLALNMPGDDNLNVSRAEINGMLSALNVTITESLDQNTFGSQSAGSLLEFPDQFTWYLFSEGSFLFLDGGQLDIGIIRDSGLVNTNDYKMFTETFEGVAFVGIESLAITSQIAVNGSAAALRDTTGGAAAAPAEY